MDIFFSDFFEVSPEIIDEYGAFNVSLVNDLPLFVDPFLLFNSESSVYQQLHAEIIKYMRFLKKVSLSGEINRHLVNAWFTFPEVKQNWLGFSLSGNKGHGLGMEFAHSLNRNLNTVFRDFGEEEVTRDSHLEKLCLVREGVGRDNVSDFTTNLIKRFLAEYTQNFAVNNLREEQTKKVRLSKIVFNYETRSWKTELFTLPYISRDYVLLTPKDILTKDETWINRSELLSRFQDIASSLPNETLRAQVNQYLLRVLPKDPKASKKDRQAAISQAVDNFPEVIDYYILGKEDEAEEATSVAQKRVTEVQNRFVQQVGKLVREYLEPGGFYQNSGNTYGEAKERVLFLKDVIENKGGHRLFYVKNKPVEREADLQILYRLTWFATPSNISREVNDGRGPVDFEASRGRADKTLVEFKLARNSQLQRNLAKQCEIYEKASDPTYPTLKVILYFSISEHKKVERILSNLDLKNSPHIILIDARDDNKPSGSKA